jgi:hypothetical protein
MAIPVAAATGRFGMPSCDGDAPRPTGVRLALAMTNV